MKKAILLESANPSVVEVLSDAVIQAHYDFAEYVNSRLDSNCDVWCYPYTENRVYSVSEVYIDQYGRMLASSRNPKAPDIVIDEVKLYFSDYEGELSWQEFYDKEESRLQSMEECFDYRDAFADYVSDFD